MKLFNTADHSKNLLPYDGCVNYYGIVCDSEKGYFEKLMHGIEWKNDQAVIFGRHIETKRKVAWYGDKRFEYSYSNILKIAQPCLLNLYHNGSEGMAWHSDGEKDLKKHGVIASLTFGAERKFSFKHKNSKEKIDIFLEDGSLLIMKDQTQDHWLHRLPPTKTIHGARINLTFRTIENA